MKYLIATIFLSVFTSFTWADGNSDARAALALAGFRAPTLERIPDPPAPEKKVASKKSCCSPACTCGCNEGEECNCDPKVQPPVQTYVPQQVYYTQPQVQYYQPSFRPSFSGGMRFGGGSGGACRGGG